MNKRSEVLKFVVKPQKAVHPDNGTVTKHFPDTNRNRRIKISACVCVFLRNYTIKIGLVGSISPPYVNVWSWCNSY